MTSTRGFTLLEIIVIFIILGIMATILASGLFGSLKETRAQQAKNNLLAISAAEQKYFEDYGYYCSNQAPNPNCGANPMANLSLSAVLKDTFNYSCTGSPYTCTARDSTYNLTLILNPNAQPPVTCTVGGSYCPS